MNPNHVEKIVRLREGRLYTFHIIGIMLLPDGTEHFVLTDPNRVKHLLERKRYLNYGFEIGQYIKCRVDKINCNGKIYIEPLHPYYRIGKVYDFPVVRIDKYGNKENEKEVVLEDVFGNEIKFHVTHFNIEPVEGQVKKLSVANLKKGKVVVSEPGLDIKFNSLEVGKEYPFEIVDFIDLQGKGNYFIIAFANGAKYKLRNKYYEKYGFEVGHIIQCRLVKSGREFFLEPKHPKFVIHQTYPFDITGEETIFDYPNGEKKVIVLKNDYGKNIYFPKENLAKCEFKNGKIFCTVKDIRKGKVKLRCEKAASPI